jgi:PAS domain S-box-containing protein
VEYRGDTLVLRASRPLQSGDGEAVGLHLVKLIDDTFCRQLAIDSPATATFVTPMGKLTGLPKLPSRSPFAQAMADQRGYARIIDQRNGLGLRYNASLRNAGTMLSEDGPASLHLAVLLDAAWQDERLHMIGRSLLVSSLFSIGLSAALVLLGSWTLSKPVMRLTSAMQQVAEGDFSARLSGSSSRETKTLFDGFNGMVSQLERDVRERERHIEEITALTNANETIFQSIGTGMITVDRNLHIQRVNSAAFELLGLEEASLRGSHLRDVQARELGPHLVEVAGEVLAGRGPVTGRLKRSGERVYRLDGFSLRAVAGRNGPVSDEGCLLIVDDVTEKVSLEERMVRAEKLSSLAILTAGVAHEINNPLSSITTNVQNIADEIEDPDQRRAIHYIQQETRRIRDIVGRLLEFAGKNGRSHRWADINEEVRLVLATVRYSFPSDTSATVETDLAEGLPRTSIPGDEVRQILLNLVTNAFQATDDKGGTVRVTTGRTGEYLALEVTDDGVGIPTEKQQRIFDPFFTTKPEGSGLGLSVVYGLLNKYGGSCTIRSTEGEGTAVRLTLPVWSEETA